MQHLEIKIVEGSIAPRYEEKVKEVKTVRAVITEKGMESGLPLIDFQLTDASGHEYYFAVPGRFVNMLSAAVKGINVRNHGTEEP